MLIRVGMLGLNSVATLPGFWIACAGTHGRSTKSLIWFASPRRRIWSVVAMNSLENFFFKYENLPGYVIPYRLNLRFFGRS
jgi:hypothetical protein